MWGVLACLGILALGTLWLAVMGSGDNRESKRHSRWDNDWDD